MTFITLSAVSAVSAGSVIYVNGSSGNDNNDGSSWTTAKLTIKNATGTISDGGTVNLANGVYQGSGNTNIIINKSMTITGESKSGTIITGTNSWQIFQIKKPVPSGPSSSDINVIILNLTIANGNANNGGAISNEGILNVKGCTFKSNSASSGGAIFNQGTLDITGSTFSRNSASGIYGSGGAIYNTGTLTVINSAFTGNSAYDGSAIYNNGTLTAHFNRIFGYEYDRVNGGVFCIGSWSKIIYNHGGTVDAELNWWGHNNRPTNVYPSGGVINPGGEISGFTVDKWLVMTINANSNSLINTNSNIIADLRYDNYGTLHTEGSIPDGTQVTFTTNFGTIVSNAYTVNGIAQSTLKSALGGIANVSVSLDGQGLFKLVKIIDKVPPKVSSTYPKKNATGISRTSTIYIKFNENIKASTYWSKIYIKNMKTGKKAVIRKSIKGNTLYIKMSSKRYAYTWYQVYIPKAAIKDSFNNNLSAYYTFKFKTGKYPLNYQ